MVRRGRGDDEAPFGVELLPPAPSGARADDGWSTLEAPEDAPGRRRSALVVGGALAAVVLVFVVAAVVSGGGGGGSSLSPTSSAAPTTAPTSATHAATTASILRAEPGPLSDEEVADALAMRCAYVRDEVVLVDWFAALLVGDDMEDERLVLELTVAELLELRALDEQLDRGVDAAYALLTRKRSWLTAFSTRAQDLGLVSQLQADAAVLFEGVDNALKLLGDQYLARLYRVASERFHLPQWDAAIERKLRVLDGIYEKLASRAASRRFELLEIVIIVLISISTLLPFLPSVAP